MKYGLTVLMLLAAVAVRAVDTVAAEPTPCRELVYKTIGDAELKLHIFNPPGHQASDQRPAIIFFFGGGWVGGNPNQFYPHCDYLASRGMVAMSAEYRVKDRHGTGPRECVKDGKSAIRWVRAHAAELGVDPDRILAGGGSAGGQVAAAAATVDGCNDDGDDLAVSERPAALVLFNPVYDNGPGGYGHDRVREYWQTFSPMHNLSEKTPPTIVFFGTEDRHVSVATAKKYKKLMEDNGVRCDLHLYEDQGHGFFNLKKNPEHYHKTVAEMDRFLVSLGYLGEPTSQRRGTAGQPEGE